MPNTQFYIAFILLIIIILMYLESIKLRKRATFDPLSTLYRREEFMALVGKELERAVRFKHPATLLFIDIDNFKLKNDQFGHSEGDAVIIGTGKLMKGCSRSFDLVGRVGGEEFCVFLPETKIEGALAYSKRLIDETKNLTLKSGPITYSIGIAEFPVNGKDFEALYKSSDQAMYEAKKVKDKIVVASEVFL